MNKKDSLIIFIAFGILVVTGAMLFFKVDLFKFVGTDTGERIGLVDQAVKDVRRKREAALEWSNISSDTVVYVKDKVFTRDLFHEN